MPAGTVIPFKMILVQLFLLALAEAALVNVQEEARSSREAGVGAALTRALPRARAAAIDASGYILNRKV